MKPEPQTLEELQRQKATLTRKLFTSRKSIWITYYTRRILALNREIARCLSRERKHDA